MNLEPIFKAGDYIQLAPVNFTGRKSYRPWIVHAVDAKRNRYLLIRVRPAPANGKRNGWNEHRTLLFKGQARYRKL